MDTAQRGLALSLLYVRRHFTLNNDCVIAIESSKLFAGITPAEGEMLRKVTQVREFPSGSVIFEEGDVGDGLYIVHSGAVEISAVVNGQERRPLARVGPGDFFGEMSVLDNEPRSATALTEGPTVTSFINRRDLLDILEQSPRLSVGLVREFSLRMRNFNRRYIEEVLQAERLTLVGRFARSIVHDFKNPLNVIGLAADMVASETMKPEFRRNSAARIRKQVDRLSNMINELLEFTRGSQASVVLAETDIPRFVDSLLEDLRPELSDKRVEILCETEIPNIRVLLDPKRVAHVFFNLFHNAVDAMPDGGKIILRFRQLPTELQFEVEDTGAGIAPEIAPRLFEAFATFGKVQGTGLGLSICKRIVNDHRGWIKAVSNPGRGALFIFGLPLAAPNSQTNPIAE